MDSDNNQKWFSSISPPESSLKETVSYLDRLIGGTQQRPYQHNNRQQQQKSHRKGNNNKHKGGPANKFKNQINKTHVPTVNIDDATWLAERRKKFPKYGSQQQTSDKGASDDNAVPKEPKKERRKTLFEKLMEQQ